MQAWSGGTYPPLSFDRPEPLNRVFPGEQITDPLRRLGAEQPDRTHGPDEPDREGRGVDQAEFFVEAPAGRSAGRDWNQRLVPLCLLACQRSTRTRAASISIARQ